MSREQAQIAAERWCQSQFWASEPERISGKLGYMAAWNAATEAERERCATLCGEWMSGRRLGFEVANDIAAAIRKGEA